MWVLRPDRDHFAEKRAGFLWGAGGPAPGVGSRSWGSVGEERLNQVVRGN